MQKGLLQKADKARQLPLNETSEKLVIPSLSKDGKFITRKEVKEILNISYPTLYRHTVRGDINVYGKIGCRLLYNEDEIRSSKILFNKILRKKNAQRKPIITNRNKSTSK